MNPWTMWATMFWVWPIMAMSAADQAMSRAKIAEWEAQDRPYREADDAQLERVRAMTTYDWRAIGIEPPVPVRRTATVAEMAARNARYLGIRT